MNKWVFVTALGFWVSALGCGSTTPKPPVVAAKRPTGPSRHTGDDMVQGDADSRGAEFSLGNGTHLSIPRGAVTKPTRFLFAVGPNSAALSKGGRRIISPMLVIEPGTQSENGAPFVISSPMTMIPSGYSEEDLALAVEEPAGERAMDMSMQQTRWQFLPAYKEGNRVLGETETLPGLRVAFVVTESL